MFQFDFHDNLVTSVPALIILLLLVVMIMNHFLNIVC